eukprot:2251283-Rhodomonas_salina.2
MVQYPKCGWNPLRILSNTAGRKGGGLYSSGCHNLEESRGVCFLGGIELSKEPSVMVVIHDNQACLLYTSDAADDM